MTAAKEVRVPAQNTHIKRQAPLRLTARLNDDDDDGDDEDDGDDDERKMTTTKQTTILRPLHLESTTAVMVHRK